MRVLLIICLIASGFLSSLNAQPWFHKSNFGGEARHRSTSFTIGSMGYIGLGHINSGVDTEFEDFWKYDPASDSWSQIANYPEGRCFHSTAFVIGNKAYVGTGRLENGTFSKKFFVYDPTFNSWTPIADLPGAQRRGAIGFALNGKGYVGTGQTTGGYVADFYEYNPVNNQWLVKANFPGPARTSSVAFSIDNFGYVGTGNTNVGSINDFYRYDPSLNQWTMRANVGPINRQEAVGFAVNGMGYIGTGDDFSSGNNFKDMWEYDPTLNTWVQIEDFDGTARRYLTAFVIGSRAYAGTGTNGTNFRDFWMFDQILSVLERNMKEIAPMAYPNPADETFTIDLGDLPDYVDLADIHVEIYNTLGTEVLNEKMESLKTKLNIGSLNEGMFIYRLTHKNEPFFTGKLIVQ